MHSESDYESYHIVMHIYPSFVNNFLTGMEKITLPSAYLFIERDHWVQGILEGRFQKCMRYGRTKLQSSINTISRIVKISTYPYPNLYRRMLDS